MDHSAQASNGGPLRRTVTITNPHGFHLRPMQAFVELAAKYQSVVRVKRNDLEPVDGKSIWNLMLLGAEQGSELTIEVDGADAAVAIVDLVELLANLESRVNVDETS